MRLAVDVGSMQEDEDQRGLAPFTEHMAFNGSKIFPKMNCELFTIHRNAFWYDLNATHHR